MTTRRPPLAHRPRPPSQIYIGNSPNLAVSTPPDIPDLPEPPSPSSSTSSLSGLPSPPATNSTGSGSTGDPGSIAIRAGSSPSLSSNMLNGSNLKAFHAAFQHNHNDQAPHRLHYEEPDDIDNDIDDDGEDNTARLDKRRHSASENVLALQRVKSLTQRNKIALDKLSSFSRLSTPSPTARSANSTRSPLPPSLHASSSTSGSGSGSGSHYASSSSHSSSSHSSSNRPPIRRSRTQDPHQSGSETERDDLPTNSPHRPTTPLVQRQRLISAPVSPSKQMAASSSSASNTRSPRRTTRASNLSFSSRAPVVDDDSGGPSSPEDTTRAALAAVASARRSPGGTARYTGTRISPTLGAGKRRQPLPREWGNGRFSAEPPLSPPQPDRSPSKRHSLAESIPSTRHAHSSSTSSTSTIGTNLNGRPSTVRDLTRKHQTRWLSEDMGSSPVTANGEGRERRQSLRSGSAESALGGAGRLVGEGLRAAGLAGRGDVFSERDRMTPARAEAPRRSGSHVRAATSMADYDTLRREESALRTYRNSAYSSDGPGRSGSALDRHRDISVEREQQERDRQRTAPSPSPYGSIRRHGGSGSGSAGNPEHARLMSDSLAMFEGHLSRVAAGSSATDLARSAQIVVSAAERLNGILRAGTARALEAQIDAEVSDAETAELAEVWRRVGGEYRDGLRISDELVRAVTGFLLGVGRVVREFGESRASDEGRGGSSHGSASPDAGRRSSQSRRSWDAKEGRESSLAMRPIHGSAMAPPARNPTPSSRRLLTPREQRELKANGLVPSDSQTTVQQVDYEPSPTPASRKQNDVNRTAPLPPIAIPKPLPNLPSESPTLRRPQTTVDKPTASSAQRRRTITSSTVRAGGSGLLPSMTTPTTALTPHTVSNSPTAFPSLVRNDSDRSTRSRGNTVTFSRPSTVALAGLQMQHDRERERTLSNSDGQDEAIKAALAASERESRYRSIRPRMSLDGGEDRSTSGPQKRERRRTVTDIWPQSGSS
ncbi:unnamed protein product [Mycena citricolor]|uniref:Uncharacterized protein n=1 Tax=Mycena citricolor TaxID=2018698 RepID=A0AAD2HI55_9AGAR|nr:unnamed protein product [Mycena citricolor]